MLEARLIRELKPPYNRMLKGAAPSYFLRIDLMDAFPRLVVAGRMTARRGVMQIGPFIGRRSLDQAVRALARILGLRTCADKIVPDANFSPCIYGQMGHCVQPCNATIDEDGYGARVRRALAVPARASRSDHGTARRRARPGRGRDALRGGLAGPPRP